MRELTLQSPLDMHLHLRDGALLRSVAPLTARNFSGALIMPNLTPSITTVKMALSYRDRILDSIKSEFKPYMTLFLKGDTSTETLEEVANSEDILGMKLYPDGATTNSKGGINSFASKSLLKTLEIMQSLNIPLIVHGESSGFSLDREREFMEIYEDFAKRFPKLKIMMEHITTKEATKLLDRYENLFATVTAHHLYITLDDVLGASLKPHLFCKPIAKTPEDREALRELVFSDSEKVMFGSDSAPHLREQKECESGSAGVFSAPIALELLVSLFDKFNALDRLEKFVTLNAQKIYNITPIKKEIKLIQSSFEIPEIFDGVVPFFAKERLNWRVK